jgi:DNA-binding NtrC family response regulator
VGKGRILILDDEVDLVDTCVRLLSRHGYGCVVGHTAREGVKLITEQRPDLVITDLYLPDLDGLSVLRHAREQTPPIPGILMTAHPSPRNATEAYDAGAMFYLAKPFSNAALLELVGRALP